MKNSKTFLFIIYIFIISTHSFSQELTPKEQKIQDELTNIILPELPEEDEMAVSKKDDIVPAALDIDSAEVIKEERTIPNEGNPYFTFSAGLAPFQASIGILKYFIPEWWGQADINLVFLPSIPVPDYYKATKFYKPYVAFRITTGWAFYSYRKFEMSLIAQVQFAFISSDDIPILPSLGMRFIIDFFYLDIGVTYAFIASGVDDPIFTGWYPAISIGFRF